MSDELICVIYARTPATIFTILGWKSNFKCGRAYAEKRGLAIVGEYADAGVSGLEPNKPALKAITGAWWNEAG